MIRRCVYCGAPVRFSRLTCAAHRDLPALDPWYQTETVRRCTTAMTYCHDCGHAMPGPNKLARCPRCRSVFIGYVSNGLLR